ncbi:MAG: prolipoprotein diacylglyceryl transferase [Lachnospiraceae bacterium]|nr:prolipoprotein diacylglyceryl transferase [Lachnospiraceae bacterium]
MMNSIAFPNIGIEFENVGQSLQLFGYNVAYYGIIIGVGMVLGGALVLRKAHVSGYSQDDILDCMIAGLIAGVIGARLYYVVFSWDYYGAHPSDIFNLRQGGLGIYGGIIFGTIAGVLMMIHKKIPVPVGADFCIFGFPVGQCIGRWGNFFNREAFGEYTNGLFAMRLPVDAVRSSDDITELMVKNAFTVDGTQFITVHPTFLYESAWNLLVLIVLLLVFNKRKFDGEIFCLYFLLYGIGRAMIEPLRTDQLKLLGTDIPVSVVVSVIMIILSSIGLIYGFKKGIRRPRPEKKQKPEKKEEK